MSTEKTQTAKESEKIYERAIKVLTGGVSRNTIFRKPHPFYVSSANGSYITDIDGCQRLDFANNMASLIHGHSHPKIVEAVTKQLKRGSAFTMGSEIEVTFAELLNKVSESKKNIVLIDNHGKSEIEMNKFWQITSKCIKNCITKSKIEPSNISAIGITGNMVGAWAVDKFNKPVILISLDGNIWKASARSVVGFDIGSVIIAAAQEKILIKGGGHKMAGGFSIQIKNIKLFKDFVFKRFKGINEDLKSEKPLLLDSVCYKKTS